MIGSARLAVSLLVIAAALTGCSLIHHDQEIETPVMQAALASWMVRADVEQTGERQLKLKNVEPLLRLDHPEQPALPEERLDDSPLEAVNGASAPLEGKQLVLFVSMRTDDRIVVQYAHDPRTDTAAGEIGDVVATSGATVRETLECLRERADTESRLDALVAAVEQAQADPNRQANDLYRCEV